MPYQVANLNVSTPVRGRGACELLRNRRRCVRSRRVVLPATRWHINNSAFFADFSLARFSTLCRTVLSSTVAPRSSRSQWLNASRVRLGVQSHITSRHALFYPGAASLRALPQYPKMPDVQSMNALMFGSDLLAHDRIPPWPPPPFRTFLGVIQVTRTRWRSRRG